MLHSVWTASGARNALVSSVYRTLLITAAIVVGIDQLTKEMALAALSGGPIDVIEGVVTFRLSYNPGGAFGILQGIPTFFLFATIAVAIAIVLWARHIERPAWGIPLGLVLGGGIGNLIDRLARDTGGRVIDFIDLHVWPIFNIADSAIVIGVATLIFVSARADREERLRTADSSDMRTERDEQRHQA